MKLHDLIKSTLTDLGVGEQTYDYEAPAAERFVLSDADAASYKEAIEALFSSLESKGFAAKDFHVSVTSNMPNVKWERDKRFSDKHVLSLPLMHGTYNQEPQYDLTFGELLARLKLSQQVAELFADGMQNKKLGSAALPVQVDRSTDPLQWESRLAVAKPAVMYWLGVVDRYSEDRVELIFDRVMRWQHTVYQGGHGEPSTLVISAYTPEDVPMGQVHELVAAFDEAGQNMMQPLMMGDAPNIYVRPWIGMSLDVSHFQLFNNVAELSSAIAAHVKAEGLANGKVQLNVMLAEDLSIDVNRSDYGNRIDIRIPCLHMIAWRQAESPEAFFGSLAQYWDRAKRVMDWMDKDCERKVGNVRISYKHFGLTLEDAKLDALLAALLPHVKATPALENGAGFRLAIDGPDSTPARGPYGNITLPLEYLEVDQIKPAIDAFFAEFPAN